MLDSFAARLYGELIVYWGKAILAWAMFLQTRQFSYYQTAQRYTAEVERRYRQLPDSVQRSAATKKWQELTIRIEEGNLLKKEVSQRIASRAVSAMFERAAATV